MILSRNIFMRKVEGPSPTGYNLYTPSFVSQYEELSFFFWLVYDIEHSIGSLFLGETYMWPVF